MKAHARGRTWRDVRFDSTLPACPLVDAVLARQLQRGGCEPLVGIDWFIAL
jgi:hypothetical protein